MYVYQYDKNDHYPLIQLFYEGKEIELNLSNKGISSVIYNGEAHRGKPREIGLYEVEYWVTSYDYKQEEDKEKYKFVSVKIFVEIQ